MEVQSVEDALTVVRRLNGHSPIGYVDEPRIEEYHSALIVLERFSGFDLSAFCVDAADYKKVPLSPKPSPGKKPRQMNFADSDRVQWRTLKSKIEGLLTRLGGQTQLNGVNGQPGTETPRPE